MTTKDEFYSDYPFLFNPDQGRWGDWLACLDRFDTYDFSLESLKGFIPEDPLNAQELDTLCEAILLLSDAVKEIRQRDIKRLPHEAIGHVASAADVCCKCVDMLREMPNVGESHRKANIYQCIKDASDLYERLASSFAISSSGMDARSITRLLNEAKESSSSISELRSSIETHLKNLRSESERVINELRKDLHDRLASDEAKRFETLAKTYGDAAWYWLAASIGLAVVIVVVAGLFYWHVSELPDTISTGRAIQLSVAKLVIISVASFMLFTCVRNYRANRHNQVLSMSRATTMEVYRAFLLSVEGPEAKDKLLCLVAEMAFNLRQTGYDFSGREDAHPMQQIFDIHNLTKPPTSQKCRHRSNETIATPRKAKDDPGNPTTKNQARWPSSAAGSRNSSWRGRSLRPSPL